MKLKRLLSLAVLCVAGWTGNAYAYEVGQDITASVQKEWKDKTGTYQQKYTERYSGTAYSSGKFSTCLSTTSSLKVTMKYNFTL